MRNTEWFPNEPWGPKFRTFCEGDVKRSPAWDTWADALEELLNPAPGEEPEYIVKDEREDELEDGEQREHALHGPQEHRVEVDAVQHTHPQPS